MEVNIYGQPWGYFTGRYGQVSIPVDNGMTSIILKVTDLFQYYEDTIHPVSDFVPIQEALTDTIFPVQDQGSTRVDVVVLLRKKEKPLL